MQATTATGSVISKATEWRFLSSLRSAFINPLRLHHRAAEAGCVWQIALTDWPQI